MIRKILTALDGSKTSESVLPFVETMLRCADAQVILATAVKSPPRQAEEAWDYLRHKAAVLEEKGASVDIDVLIGDPAEEIIRYAADNDVDLIALCTRGLGGLKRALMGSVAEEVLRKSPVPVLIVQPRTVWSGPTKFRKILVPLDGSHRAAAILSHATDLAEAEGSDVVLFRVIPTAQKDVLPESVISSSLIEARKAVLKKGLLGEIVIHGGDPATEILEYAKGHDVDLVAMSTHGRTGLDRILYGSVAESVLRGSKTPLLVLRTAAVPREYRNRGRKVGRKAFKILQEIERAVSASPYRGK